MTQDRPKTRVRDVTGSFDFFETHWFDLKKRRDTLPLAIPQVDLSEFYEKQNFDRYYALFRPFTIMRSDSELLIFIFRSEKKMGLLIMQSDFANPTG